MRKEEQVKGLSLQLERQSELHQQLYTEYDRKYYDMQNQAANILNQSDPTEVLNEASEFLVDTIKQVQEETDDLNVDNQELRRNYSELCAEVEKLESQKGYLESGFNPASYSDESIYKAVMAIKNRIEELYDLAEELKNYSTKQEASELTNLLGYIQERLKKVREVSNVRLSNRIEG
jgi:chromosome segregation ATPase